MRPTPGRIVHYVSHGTPVRGDGTQAYTSGCRAAIVTAGPHMVPGTFSGTGTEAIEVISLCVLNPEGMFFNQHVPHGDGSATPGQSDCPDAAGHGNPFRYCPCGWAEPSYPGGTWHWPERAG